MSTNANVTEPVREIIIEPRTGWRLVDLSELRDYRDLLWNLIWRNMKGRYAQSSLGLGWVLVQPLITLTIFTLVFGRVVRIPVPGPAPFSVFVFCGLVPWLIFSGAMVSAGGSVYGESSIISKVYFPRLILPLANVLGRIFDLGVMLVLLLILMAWNGLVPSPTALVLIPFLTVVLMAAALGMGLWLASLAVQYRDVAVAIGFLAQIWMYLSPVFYPIDRIPDQYLPLYGLNPMVGVISGFRHSLIGQPESFPWMLIAESVVVSSVMLVTGALYFRRSERLFADVA